ncbi:TPA_asm: hypothetical protein [Synchytrium chytrid fungus MELD element]|nr:TPA_asm: hypothetical protein [Synchytrium chytrid fungus MELD element]
MSTDPDIMDELRNLGLSLCHYSMRIAQSVGKKMELCCWALNQGQASATARLLSSYKGQVEMDPPTKRRPSYKLLLMVTKHDAPTLINGLSRVGELLIDGATKPSQRSMTMLLQDQTTQTVNAFIELLSAFNFDVTSAERVSGTEASLCVSWAVAGDDDETGDDEVSNSAAQ